MEILTRPCLAARHLHKTNFCCDISCGGGGYIRYNEVHYLTTISGSRLLRRSSQSQLWHTRNRIRLPLLDGSDTLRLAHLERGRVICCFEGRIGRQEQLRRCSCQCRLASLRKTIEDILVLNCIVQGEAGKLRSPIVPLRTQAWMEEKNPF